MKRRLLRILLIAFSAMPLVLSCTAAGDEEPEPHEPLNLPSPSRTGEISVEEALSQRRSTRSFASDALETDVLGQLLWATQGITEPGRGLRTAPSAGATYPLEVWVAVGSVDGVDPGLYRYIPQEHALEPKHDEDPRDALAYASLRQTWIADAPVVVVLTAVFERTTSRYGPRGERYVHMEVGHAAQNLYLQAEALELGTVIVGAFDDAAVQEILNTQQAPMAVLPVGVPAD